MNEINQDATLDLLDLSGSSTEDITLGEILEQMEEAWINEKFSPEILPCKLQLLEILYSQINIMESNLEHLSKSDFRRNVHEMEISRIRFLLTSYLRVRLLKIELYFQWIYDEEEARRLNQQNDEESYLTDKEKEYLINYKNLMDNYMKEVFEFLPLVMKEDVCIKPNLHSFIFFKAKTNINGVVVDDGQLHEEVIDVSKSNKMIMSYRSISNLLKNDQITLI